MDFERTGNYISERFKRRVTDLVTSRLSRLRSPMQSIVAQLQAKRLMPQPAHALELFGLYGFWVTMDYLPFVESVDFFELDENRIDLSKRNLPHDKVRFHAEDSVAYVARTDRKYNFIVADPPIGDGLFYDAGGLPVYFENLIRIADTRAVIAATVAARSLERYQEVEEQLRARAGGRKIVDFFFQFASFDMYNWTVTVLGD
jgi:hypothetical protein